MISFKNKWLKDIKVGDKVEYQHCQSKEKGIVTIKKITATGMFATEEGMRFSNDGWHDGKWLIGIVGIS